MMKTKKLALPASHAAVRAGGVTLHTPGALIAAEVRAGGLHFQPGRAIGGIQPFRKPD